MVERCHSLRRTGGTVKSRGVGVVCIVVSSAVVGCGAVANDRAIRDEGRVVRARPWREVMGDIDAFQTVSHNNVTVYHPEDLAPQAQQFAVLTARQLSHLQEETGFEPRFPKINVYMKRTQNIRRAIRDSATFHFPPSDGALEFILFVGAADESCEGIVAADLEYPCVLMHELVELSLITLRGDYRWKTSWGWPKERLYFTRWFREGYANYCGFLAHRMTVFDDGSSRARFPAGVYQQAIHRHPFSSLARVGKDLFTWHQYYEDPTPWGPNPNLPHVGNTNIEYYDAALGLFLVMEDRYGRDAIRKVMDNVYRLEDGDGEAVKEIVNRVLGTDIVKLVEGFRFPETGLYMNACWPGHTPYLSRDLPTKEGLSVQLVGPDSPAQRAGMSEGDVVISVDGQRTVTNLDFEFALYERMHQKEVELGVWREGVGAMSVQLKLDE